MSSGLKISKLLYIAVQYNTIKIQNMKYFDEEKHFWADYSSLNFKNIAEV